MRAPMLIERTAAGAIAQVTPLRYIHRRNLPSLTNAAMRRKEGAGL